MKRKRLRQTKLVKHKYFMPKISVIVPVYNTEKYLRRCIDSILAQTFTDFELLLVDDGSKDNSGTICDEYVEKDPRVRVFHKENGGVTAARNMGIEEAKGEWLAFVDADDYILLDYLAIFFRATLAGCTMVCATDGESATCCGRDYINGLLSNIYFWGMPCKLYHQSLFKATPLDIPQDIFIGEDLLANLLLSAHVDRVAFVKNEGYKYFNNVESVTHTRKYCLEQQERFLRKVEKIVGSDNCYADALWLFKIRAWKSLLLNNELIGHEVPFVKEILGQSRYRHFHLGIGDKVLLNVSNRYAAWALIKVIYLFKNRV